MPTDGDARGGPSGYADPLYAASFADAGTPVALARSGGWLVERPIPDTSLRDAMGCYPLFDCERWTDLADDLARLHRSLVSVTLVTTPFAPLSELELRQAFDVVRPFKHHYVVDLTRTAESWPARQHRRNLSKALRSVQVRPCPDPVALLDEWSSFYEGLCVRHGVSGMRAFSKKAFHVQLRVPGLVMFRAEAEGRTVGLHLWYERGEVAYGHLGATSPEGYDRMASYALYWHAAEHFRPRVRWLDLGGAPGLEEPDTDDGLRAFKSGWSTDMRPSFLCGRILQPLAYDALTAARAPGEGWYFPAYRAGEFGRKGEAKTPSSAP